MDIFQKEYHKRHSAITEINTYLATIIFLGLIQIPIGIAYNFRAIYILSLFTIIGTFIWHHVLNRYISQDLLNFLETFIDLALIFVVVCLSGGASSILFPVFVLPVINSAGSDRKSWNILVLFATLTLVVTLLLVNYSNVFLVKSLFFCIILILADYRAITARDFMHKAELAYSRRQAKVEELTEINNYKDEFVYMATHEIRSPITVIRGYLDLLIHDKGNTFSEKSQDILGRLQEHVESLSVIVQEMLDISKIETGKVVVNKTKCNINETINTVMQELMVNAVNKGVTLTFTPAKDEELFAKTDRDRLKEILINLIENAVKYSEKGGEVVVSTKLNTNNYVEISVKDNGIGIPTADQSKIFQKFFRAHNVYEQANQGTGLGLYIVYRLIDLLNGYIQFASEEGKGTTFKIQLPA